MKRHPRQLWLIGLMVLTLAGLQLVQSSALHDHVQHSAECLLCHQPVSDDPSAQQLPGAVLNARMQKALAPAAESLQSRHRTVYRSRGPPSLNA